MQTRGQKSKIRKSIKNKTESDGKQAISTVYTNLQFTKILVLKLDLTFTSWGQIKKQNIKRTNYIKIRLSSIILYIRYKLSLTPCRKQFMIQQAASNMKTEQ